MSQTLVHDSLIKNTMLPRKVASQITAEGKKKGRGHCLVYFGGSVSDRK